MDATFYVSSAPTHKVDKRQMLTQLKVLNGLKPFQPFDVEEGQLILKYDEDLHTKCNYVKIDDFYYFVKTPILRVGEQIVLECTKDVLMSNLEEILNMDVIINRNSVEYNSYMFDNQQLGQVNYTTFSQVLGALDFSESTTILAAIGGKVGG